MQLDSLLGRLSSLNELRSHWEEWRDRLRECLPTRLRRLLGQDVARLEIELRPAGADVSLRSLDKVQVLDELSGPQDPGLGKLQPHLRSGKTRIVLRLPEQQVLQRRVRLPLQVRGNLPQVLGFEMDRLTPFEKSQVLFDYRELQATQDERLVLQLALTRRDYVDAWLKALAANKMVVSELVWEGAWPRANMLKGEGLQGVNRTRLALRWLQWLLVLGLLAAVLITPLWQKRAVVIEEMQRVDLAKRQAGAVTRMRTQLEEAQNSAHHLIDRKRNAVVATNVLLRLTQLVPDDSWIQQFQLDGNRVEIRGQSEESTRLIQVLSEEPSFRDVSFKSPVVVVRNSEKSRYHIEFTVRPAGGAE